MKKLTNKRGLALSTSKGFTLIEVVLVLAIGGLIFLLAFLAFQQVSRNRRDTQRRADVHKVVAELENYKTNTGDYPADGGHWAFGSPGGVGFTSTFIPQYMGGDKFKDPSGHRYLEEGNIANKPAPNLEYAGSGLIYWPMQYGKNQKCSGADFIPQQGSVAVKIKLESGAVYCRSTQ